MCTCGAFSRLSIERLFKPYVNTLIVSLGACNHCIVLFCIQVFVCFNVLPFVTLVSSYARPFFIYYFFFN